MAQPHPDTSTTSRTVMLLSAAAILVLGAFAGWASMTTHRSAEQVRHSTTLSDAYSHARNELLQEELLVRDYRLAPDPAVIDQVPRTARALRSALRVVEQLGTDGDRALATRVLRENTAALAAVRQMAAAVNAGDANRSAVIDERRLRPAFSSMLSMVDRATVTHRMTALASLRSTQTTETIVLAVTVTAFALGVLLVVAVASVLRYRARLERVRQAELERFAEAALTDNLTGLRNHRAFQEDLDRALSAHAETGRPLTLVLIDLDGLKQINDSAGHQAGDECIVGLAQVLATAGRSRDAAYRIGGDEFALIIPGERAMNALYLVQRLQSQLPATRSGIAVSATAGLAEPPAGADKDELIRQADMALLRAKRSHRRSLVYTPALESETGDVPDWRAAGPHPDTLATALARAVDAKDSYTHSHCETVSELCALLAHELGFEPERVGQMRLAGLLHDVGKIGIVDSILQKPGPLTDAEYTVMKTHTRLGYDIVRAAERYEEARWILHHHERPDGRGYPDGLAGDDVPFESRIILVADAFEAITADRPYRDQRSTAEALEELDRHSGTQFDPRCVEALRRVIVGREQLVA
jgi:diguanylate cyclase (GGDEF)-like protein/putative nucleotidyltransferase with HDIG domain